MILSSVRIVVEHAIAGVKRCRIVKEVLCLTKDGIADLVMAIACGLHHFRVDCRNRFSISVCSSPLTVLYAHTVYYNMANPADWFEMTTMGAGDTVSRRNDARAPGHHSNAAHDFT